MRVGRLVMGLVVLVSFAAFAFLSADPISAVCNGAPVVADLAG
jgi:hypothetical protein